MSAATTARALPAYAFDIGGLLVMNGDGRTYWHRVSLSTLSVRRNPGVA
jgi:hypothetical protein